MKNRGGFPSICSSTLYDGAQTLFLQEYPAQHAPAAPVAAEQAPDFWQAEHTPLEHRYGLQHSVSLEQVAPFSWHELEEVQTYFPLQ